MIDTDTNGELFVQCEQCGILYYGGTLEFHDFVRDIKKRFWKIQKIDGEWRHTCPTCPPLPDPDLDKPKGRGRIKP